jgi:hypothetical protein
MLLIGRDVANDIVIDHPTVSRRHAVLQQIGDGFFIMDLDSRNGTRVNGRSARERRALEAGDKVRIGQVRAVFAVADAARTPSLDHGAAAGEQGGILFRCVCGTRLWAKAEAATGAVTCRKCGQKVVVPAKSTSPESGETVVGVAYTESATNALSAPVQRGTCSICQWPTNTDDSITTCPSCGLTFHTECWNENCGCSAYGCAQVNAITTQAEASAQATDVRETAVPSVPAKDPPASQGISAAHAMLAASIVAGVIGLIAFGATSLIVLIVSALSFAKRRRSNGRGLLIGAMSVALLGVIAGACVSSIVWLGWSPGVQP